MVTQQSLADVFGTARRLVDLLDSDGFKLDAAVWVLNEEGAGRLYLVPSDQSEGQLNQTKRVAHVISAHKDELPERHDLHYTLTRPDNGIVRAVISAGQPGRRIKGAYSNGTYIDEAYILRPAA